MVADHAAFAGTTATGLFDPFALAAASGANLAHLKETIGADHVPLTTTSRAATLLGACLGATAGTFLAGLVLPVGHLTADPSGRLFERQGDLMAQVFARRFLRLATAAKHIAATAATEHLIKDVHRVSTALGSLAATAAAGAALFESRRALLVVKPPLRFIGQHLIDAGDLFEFFLSGLIAGVPVRVKLHRLLAIGFLNFIRRRALGNAEQGVIIFFHRRRNYLFAGPVETKTAAGRRTRSCNDQPGRATRVTEPSGTVSLASCETASWCEGLKG